MSVTSIASDVSGAVLSLNVFQQSLADVNAQYGPLLDLGLVVRKHSEGLRQHLNQCLVFAKDVFLVEELLRRHDTAKLKEAVRNMEASATEQQNRWRNLQRTDMPFKPRSNPNDINIASMSPDSHDLLSKVKDALANINTHIINISNFWNNTKDQFRQYTQSGVVIPMEDANKLVADWLRYQKAIEKAVVSLAKSEDELSLDGDAEDVFAGYTPPPVSNELSVIVSSAKGSLDMITLWCEVETDNAVIANSARIIRRLANRYCNAIDISIDTAQKSHDLSHDIIGLCDHLRDPETSVDALRDYISDMKACARQCHRRTEDVQKTFLEVYAHILELSKALPDEVVRHTQAKQSPRLFTFFSGSGQVRTLKGEDVMRELQLVAVDLGRLSKGVTEFADWWGTMVTKLATLESSAEKLKPQAGRNDLRLKSIRGDWENMERKYEDYRNDIAKLVHSYPRNLLEDADDRDAAQISKEISAIVKRAKGSLDLMNLWRKVKSQSSIVTKAATILRDQSQTYSQTISLSVMAAQECRRLSLDAVRLCKQILEHKLDSAKHLSEMKKLIPKFHQQAEDVRDEFVQYYDCFAQVSKTLSHEVVKNAPARFLPRMANYFRWGAKEPEIVTAEEMKRLRLEPLDLVYLSESISVFSDWWSTNMTNLRLLEAATGKVTLGAGQKDENIINIKNEWENMARKCGAYYDEIDELAPKAFGG